MGPERQRATAVAVVALLGLAQTVRFVPRPKACWSQNSSGSHVLFTALWADVSSQLQAPFRQAAAANGPGREGGADSGGWLSQRQTTG